MKDVIITSASIIDAKLKSDKMEDGTVTNLRYVANTTVEFMSSGEMTMDEFEAAIVHKLFKEL